MSRWFRHYAGMVRDEKLVGAAMRSKQPVERVVWVWGAILESAAEINDGGRFDLEAGEIAYFLRADEADIVSIWDALEAMGRLCAGVVVKWGDRQFQSDQSVERQRRYRDKQGSQKAQAIDTEKHNGTSGDGEVTAASRHGDAPETETETELDTEKKDTSLRSVSAKADKNPRKWPADYGEQFWNTYPKKVEKKAALRALEKVCRAGEIGFPELLTAVRAIKPDDPKYIKHPPTWLNKGCYLDTTGPPVSEKPKWEAPPGCLSYDETLALYHGGRVENGTQNGTENGNAGMGGDRPGGREKLQLPS